MISAIMLMIIGMAVVTYIPRVIPLILLNGKKMHPFLQGVLKNVPYAALGALIIPGVFLISDSLLYGIIGLGAALITAYLGANVIVVVLVSIMTLTIFSSFLN